MRLQRTCVLLGGKWDRPIAVSSAFAGDPLQDFPTITYHLTILCVFRSRRLRVASVRCHGPPDALDPLRSSWSRALPTMKPAASVWHRRALAGQPAPVRRPTSCGRGPVSAQIPILQPSAVHATYPPSFEVLTDPTIARCGAKN